MMKHIYLFCLFFFFFDSDLRAQQLPAGPQVLTFYSSVDDTEQPYGLYIPKDYNSQKKYPLVIMLHGAGSNHRLALRRVFGKSNFEGENDVEASRYFPSLPEVDYIVATPYARGTAGYQGIPEKDVYDVLEDVKHRFSIDDDRVYLTGLSMGGGGTLWIGLSRPDVWAAIAPVCPAPPEGTEELALNALNIPVHFFHGDADPVVPVSVSRTWVDGLKEMNSNVIYKEFPGVKHDSWINAYNDASIFRWFDSYKRDNYPDHVRFASRQYKYDSAYWVKLDKIVPGELAKIEAKFVGSNKIEVNTSAVDAFTLRIGKHPKFNRDQPLQLTINGKKLRFQAQERLSLFQQKGKWINEKYIPSAGEKQKGLEGPLKEAISDRHIYVYGTGGNPSEAELQKRIETANQAAFWSADRGPFLGRVMVFPRVVADKDVRKSDLEEANLILFGTKESNILIQKYADQLPLHFTGNEEEYGMAYIYPINENYVVVSSGLPWWTGFQAQGLEGLFPVQIGSLSTLEDFVLFRNSVKNKVLKGNFDLQWKLPVNDLEILKTLNVIEYKK